MKHFTSLLILLISSLAWSQEDATTSNGTWVSFGVEKELTKKLELKVEPQFRLDLSEGEHRSALIDAGLKYKFIKNVYGRFEYRYALQKNERNAHRLSFDLGAKWKVKQCNLTFKYRARFQNSVVSYTGENSSSLRNKATMDYKLSKQWTPFVSYENFFRFNGKNEVRTHRYRGGIAFAASKKSEMKVFYQFDKEVNVGSPEHMTVFGLSWSWEL